MNLQVIEAVKVIANEELRHRFSNVIRMHKDDGSFLTEADLAVQTRIQKLLQEKHPEILPTFLRTGKPMLSPRIDDSGGQSPDALNKASQALASQA